MTTTTTTGTTMTRTLSYGKGYAGKTGNRCWAARITGSDDKFALRREFLDATNVEREHFNRARTTIRLSYELEVDGLYELCESGERWIVGIYRTADGAIKAMRLSDARATAWVGSLDTGKTPREARIASKGL